MPSNTSSPRRYDASRRQADAVARRRRVVDAAHELFLEQGYGETSINEIARRADVSAQTVYAGFESKAGVLAKVVDVVVAGDYAAVEAAEDEDVLLVRDRHDAIEALAHPDLRIRFRAVAHYAAISHARSGPILQLVDSVAGSDPAIATIAAGLIAGVREDIGLAVREIPVEELRPGMDARPRRRPLVPPPRVASVPRLHRGLRVDAGTIRAAPRGRARPPAAARLGVRVEPLAARRARPTRRGPPCR